jgi:Protein of unknown function (DUF2505)
MRFLAEQRYAAPPAEVMAAYFDRALFEALTGVDPVRVLEVIGVARDGTTATARVRYRFAAPLPGPVTAVVDPGKLTWVQESSLDLAAGSERLVIRPDHYAGMLEAAADVSYRGDGAGGTVRAVDGRLAAKGVPFFFRGKVEQAIVDGLQAHLRQEQELVARHLG